MIIPKFIIDQEIINNEIKVLNNILDQQRQLKQTLLLYLEKISDGIYTAPENSNATSLITCLDGISKSFENIKSNIDQICNLKKYLQDAQKQQNYDSEYFDKYNEDYMKLFEKISEDNIFYYSFMESLLKYMNVTFPGTQNISSSVNVKNEEPRKQVTSNKETTDRIFEENIIDISDNIKPVINNRDKKDDKDKTLIVSEKKQNVILPFSNFELENIYNNNPEKYSSIQDVIDREFTIPLKKYKNQSISRFREAFNLARNKSNLSFFKSLSLANEMFFNSNVDPTVITACKNVTELYIYLSCLEEDALNEFTCFKIVYELS